jgi:hypothetical protein
MRTRISLSLLLPPLLALTACSDQPTEPGQELASLAVTANVSGTPIVTLVVTVTGADMQRVVFNLMIQDGVASGTVQVPPGSARLFLVEAWDASGAITHEGSTTVDIRRGANPPIALQLHPRSGQVPITVTFGSIVVIVSPAVFEMEIGEQIQLVARAEDASGTPISWATFQWATDDPSRITLTAEGLVTARAPGEVRVMATFAGIGGSAIIELRHPQIILEAITGGWGHSCGLTPTGAAYCWGQNYAGQLGDGTTEARSQPVPVVGGHTFTQISAGEQHTIALTPTGTVYAWGNNEAYQLGDGPWEERRSTPGPVLGEHTFIQISAGRGHNLALTAGGTAFAWGHGLYGELGLGGNVGATYIPQMVSAGIVFKQIAAGEWNSAGLSTTGVAYLWGILTDAAVPTQVSTALRFRQISIGSDHVVAIDSRGAAHAWGRNRTGQLGDGSNQDRTLPAAVAGDHTWRQIRAGYRYSIGITTYGTTYAWGTNFYGQLGTGSGTDHNVPTIVAGSHQFVEVKAALFHTLGIASDGTVYTWGDYTKQRNVPEPVPGGVLFR